MPSKFIVNSADLLRQLERIKGGLASGTTVPIMQHFLFELAPGELRLTASNYDARLSTTLEVECLGSAVLAVPGGQLLEVLRHMAPQALSCTIDAERENFALQVKSATSDYLLAGEDGRGYPVAPEMEDVASLKMLAGRLQRGLAKTQDFATSDAQGSPIEGLSLRVVPPAEGKHAGFLEFAGADPQHGIFALYRQSLEGVTALGGGPLASTKVIIPTRNLKLLTGLLPKSTDEVRVYFCARHLVVQVGELVFSCRLVEGAYPALSAMVPKEAECPAHYAADKDELQNALRRFRSFVDVKTQAVRFIFDAGQPVQLDALTPGSESAAHERLVGGEYAGVGLRIGLRLANILQSLPHLDAGTVSLRMSAADKAVLLTPIEQLTGEQLCIVFMPLNISL